MHCAEQPCFFNLPTHVSVEADLRSCQVIDVDAPPQLVLVRGLPGSGKSTFAATLTASGYLHLEADQFFVVDGVYRYDASRIRDAHRWCQEQARSALAQGRRVVVANTFTRLDEMRPYLQLSAATIVIRASGEWRNVHDVPVDVFGRMRDRWEGIRPQSTGQSSRRREQLVSPRSLSCGGSPRRHFVPREPSCNVTRAQGRDTRTGGAGPHAVFAR